MTQIMETVSVIICAYTEHRWSSLLAAVASVQQQTQSVLEIIVVIDHNPSLFQHARERIQGAHVIENGEAKGLSGARNSGAGMAQGTVVAYLDDDAIADPDWIEQHVKCYMHPDVVGVGGKIDPFWPGVCPSWFPEEFNWVVGCTYLGMPIKQAEIRNVIGANMSMRRRALLNAGGFLSSFGCNYDDNKIVYSTDEKKKVRSFQFLQHHAGDEETEMCMRVTLHMPDSKWIYNPYATVRHCVSSQRTNWSYFLWRCYDEGLGKAQLVELHGSHSSLSSERTYVYKTLPLGVARYLSTALRRRDLTCVTRAGAVVAGFLTTLTGYAIGTIAPSVYHIKEKPDHLPVESSQ